MSTPLSEASPDSLEHLFNLDPLKMTDKNIDDIIAQLRKGYVTAKAEGTLDGPKPRGAAPKKTKASGNLDLGSLGL